MATGIPREVEQFIAEAIASVEQLEILLLLYEEPARSWTVPEINQRMRSSLDSVETRLALLLDRDLVERGAESPPAYRYSRREALEPRVAALKVAYRDYRTAVIEKIYAGAADRVMDFARSFQLRSRNKPPRQS